MRIIPFHRFIMKASLDIIIGQAGIARLCCWPILEFALGWTATEVATPTGSWSLQCGAPFDRLQLVNMITINRALGCTVVVPIVRWGSKPTDISLGAPLLVVNLQATCRTNITLRRLNTHDRSRNSTAAPASGRGAPAPLLTAPPASQSKING